MILQKSFWYADLLFERNIFLFYYYESESESDVTYDQVWWPILRICALHLTHPKCTHTAVNTHPEQWAAIYAAAPGEQLGVRCKGTSVVVLRVGRVLYIHSSHLQFLPARDSNSQPFDYESDSLTIRPRLPNGYRVFINFISISGFFDE